jgi:antitoxin VapB
MLIAPIAHLEAVDRSVANRLLTDWGHKMGPIRRPNFAIDAHHVLFSHGLPVALASSGETVREVVGRTGIRREQCVELVRLCASRRDLRRVMLRLWREMVFPDVARAHGRDLAVSYQDRALHTGDTYRFDGWLAIGKGGGGGPDSRSGAPGRKMTIWAWPPETARTLLLPSALPVGRAE